MGQQRPVIHVADGVQAVMPAHARRVVDVQPCARLQPHRLEAQILGARYTPGRDEDLVGDEILPASKDTRTPSGPRSTAVGSVCMRTSTPARRRPRRPPCANGSIPASRPERTSIVT
jgi:hypothetical protein